MVANVGLAEVVKHHAFAGLGRVEVRLATVHEVGMPHKYVAFAGQENLFFDTGLSNFAGDVGFVFRVFLAADEPVGALVLVVGVEVVG